MTAATSHSLNMTWTRPSSGASFWENITVVAKGEAVVQSCIVTNTIDFDYCIIKGLMADKPYEVTAVACSSLKAGCSLPETIVRVSTNPASMLILSGLFVR